MTDKQPRRLPFGQRLASEVTDETRIYDPNLLIPIEQSPLTTPISLSLPESSAAPASNSSQTIPLQRHESVGTLPRSPAQKTIEDHLLADPRFAAFLNRDPKNTQEDFVRLYYGNATQEVVYAREQKRQKRSWITLFQRKNETPDTASDITSGNTRRITIPGPTIHSWMPHKKPSSEEPTQTDQPKKKQENVSHATPHNKTRQSTETFSPKRKTKRDVLKSFFGGSALIIGSGVSGGMLRDSLYPADDTDHSSIKTTALAPKPTETPAPIVTAQSTIDMKNATPETFEALDLPFQLHGWTLLFSGEDLQKKAALLKENERFIIRTRHTTSSLTPGVSAEIIAYPDPVITITREGIIAYPKVATLNGESTYFLPTLGIDDVSLSCEITDGENRERYDQTLPLTTKNNHPHQTILSDPPAIHPEEQIPESALLSINTLMKQYKKLGLGIWRVVMPVESMPYSPYNFYQDSPPYAAYVKDDSYRHLNILFLPSSLIDQNHPKETGQPGFPYLTAQAIDLLVHPDFEKYDQIRAKLEDLNDISRQAVIYDTNDSHLHSQHNAFYAPHISALLATESGYLIPARSYPTQPDTGTAFPYGAADILRNILPLTKHDPERLRENLALLTPDDRKKATDALEISLDIILTISDQKDFAFFFPDAKQLFQEIGYDPQVRKPLLSPEL